MPSAAPAVSATVTTLADCNENEVSEGSSDILQTPLPVLSTSKASLTERKRKLPATRGAPPATVTQEWSHAVLTNE